MMIRRSGRQNNNDFLDELAKAGGKTRNNMGPKYLIQQLMKDKDGGEWFRKVFIIIVDTILFAPSADGYCKTHIMEYIDDISDVINYNWCGYLLDMLVLAHDSWRLNRATAFTGPISFLVVCYVDRIVYKTRLVSRRFPTVKGWTAALLRRRQALEMNTGQFGKGGKEPIADPIQLEAQDKSPVQVCVTAEAQELEDDVHKAVMELIGAADVAAKAMGKLINRMKEAPDHIKNDRCYRVAAVTALKMMGLHEMEREKERHPKVAMTQAMIDDDIDNPEWVEAVENMMMVVDERYKWEADGPTFSLGVEFGKKSVS